MGKSKTWFFRNNAFLQGLNPHDLAHLDTHSTVLKVKAHQKIWDPQTMASSVYWIRNGVVALERSGKGDRITILDFKGTGDILAAEAVFLDGSHVVDARALERCELLCMDAVALRDVCARQSQLMQRLGAVLASSHRFDAQWATFLAHRTVRERVVGALLRLSGKFGISKGEGVHLTLPLTHRQIASYIGATREAVSVAVIQLKQDDIVEFNGKYAVIHNLDAVQEVLHS